MIANIFCIFVTSLMVNDINKTIIISYWEAICIKHQAWNSLYAYVEGIDLSIDGKILMECYENLFKFLTSIIREKFNKYPISKTLLVTITG